MNTPVGFAPLAEIAQKVQYGYTASASTEEIGPKFLRITDIAQERLSWQSVPFCAISEKDHERYRLRDGDIVIARTGATVGHAKCLRNPPDAVFASYLVRVRVAPGNDARYVGCVIASDDYKRFVLANAGGAAQPNANARVLTSYPVPLPSLAAQRSISAILSAYDDLIENNARRIQILEEMTRAIYREWFVEFRYPGHEDVPLVDCELGPVPAEWRVVPLEQAVTLEYGKALTAADRKAGDVVVMGSSGPVGTHDEPLVTGPGIVVGRKGNAGAVHWVEEDFFPIDTTFYVRSTHDLLFVFYQLGAIEFVASHTAVPGLSREQANLVPFVLPPAATVEQFSQAVGPMRKLIRVLDRENRALRASRDFLLPRLISGDVDVSDLDIDTSDLVA